MSQATSLCSLLPNTWAQPQQVLYSALVIRGGAGVVGGEG